jgi:hypothetical protein
MLLHGILMSKFCLKKSPRNNVSLQDTYCEPKAVGMTLYSGSVQRKHELGELSTVTDGRATPLVTVTCVFLACTSRLAPGLIQPCIQWDIRDDFPGDKAVGTYVKTLK